jgi:hypothetical protein
LAVCLKDFWISGIFGNLAICLQPPCFFSLKVFGSNFHFLYTFGYLSSGYPTTLAIFFGLLSSFGDSFYLLIMILGY